MNNFDLFGILNYYYYYFLKMKIVRENWFTSTYIKKKFEIIVSMFLPKIS